MRWSAGAAVVLAVGLVACVSQSERELEKKMEENRAEHQRLMQHQEELRHEVDEYIREDREQRENTRVDDQPTNAPAVEASDDEHGMTPYDMQPNEKAEYRAKVIASFDPSPEGMHTWVLESVDMATCGIEGISLYCVETKIDAGWSGVRCSDEDAKRILAWFDWKEEERRSWSRVVDKPFHVPSDITEPLWALDYLLTIIHHNGNYKRPSAEELRERLLQSFGSLEFPSFHDNTFDFARWREACQPLFYDNIPFGPAAETGWGNPPATNEALEAFREELQSRYGVRMALEFRIWNHRETNIRYSGSYVVLLQNERGVEVAAFIDKWHGTFAKCEMKNGVILGREEHLLRHGGR